MIMMILLVMCQHRREVSDHVALRASPVDTPISRSVSVRRHVEPNIGNSTQVSIAIENFLHPMDVEPWCGLWSWRELYLLGQERLAVDA
ncbi:uncharacterized protein SPSK_10159 [Sporothrix schenckii 1099-18]|uniref:Uncharacterized protein n=1 Tax=Sporothrix schenckii 1099-18 TaxID=1397361 RepID=A0A0F2M5J3_SPOSC|nr:uncharacterized protein SPSK_10159 [Sporothrix schenckii 1099-18]KJR84958.1 hypothetical protein SPSK_10159 [Sporothrix schenckii 1099-18]